METTLSLMETFWLRNSHFPQGLFNARTAQWATLSPALEAQLARFPLNVQELARHLRLNDQRGVVLQLTRSGAELKATPYRKPNPDALFWVEWVIAPTASRTLPAADPAEAPAPNNAAGGLTPATQLMQAVAQAVNSSLLLDDIFEALGEVLHQHLRFDEARIVLLDDTQNGIKLMVHIDADGFADLTNENHRFAGTDARIQELLQRAQPLRLPHDQPGSSLLSPSQAAASLTVPLVNKQIVVGALSLCRQQDPFTAAEQTQVELVAPLLAMAVENARFHIHVQRQAGREFIINQLTKAIRQSLELDTILSTAAQELGQVMGVSRCLIQAYETPIALTVSGVASCSNRVAVRSYSYQAPGVAALTREYWPETDIAPLECQVLALRMKEARRFLASQTVSDHGFQPNPFIVNNTVDCPPELLPPVVLQANAVQSLAIFPILSANAWVGTITLHQCDQPRSWVPEDLALFRTLAEHLGVALSQARLVSQLAQKNRELETTLLELQQAQIQLVQTEKMAVLGQFVAGIAHEINTPLGSMASNNDTLASCLKRLQQDVQPLARQLELPEGLSAKRLETMGHLLQLNRLAVQRINDIVKNLRNFARLDESERKTVDLHEGIDATLLLMRPSLPKTLQLVRQYAKDLPPVTCFPGLLNQVFMNMMVNALHATQDRRPPKLLIHTGVEPRPDGGAAEVVVTIQDNGKGIPPEQIPRIFDPGFTTKGRGVGTGLGLALCYKIVEKHQGRIEVRSQVGVGTAFRVCIPLGDPQS